MISKETCLYWNSWVSTWLCSAEAQQTQTGAGRRSLCTNPLNVAQVRSLVNTIWCSIHLIIRPTFILFHYNTFNVTNAFTICTTTFNVRLLFQHSSLFDIDMTLFQSGQFPALCLKEVERMFPEHVYNNTQVGHTSVSYSNILIA